MRSYKLLLLAGGAVFVLAGCAQLPSEPPVVSGPTTRAHNLGDPCTTADGRTGYFVRSGDKLVCSAE